MTSISSGNAALTILQQTSLSASSQGQTASDNILDIVSGKASTSSKVAGTSNITAKAAPEAAKGPREAGGIVSSEISKVQMSAMSAIGAATVNGISYDDPLIAFTPTKASVENAQAYIQKAVWSAEKINFGLEPDEVVSPREEYNAKYVQWGADRIAKGEDAEKVNREVAYFTSDKSYKREVASADSFNAAKFKLSETGKVGLESQRARLTEIFGRDLTVTYNKKGEVKIGAFELNYGNGQKMLSYGGDGTLTTYNEDGSVRNNFAKKDVAQI